MKSTPLLTIGIISWNRLHYLKATLESAFRCIKYPAIQWIVIDNVSEEPGLAEYLKTRTWLDELVFLKSDHVTAMNEVVSRARGEVLLLWPDDMQFIVEGDWMEGCVEILLANGWIGSMGLNCLRRNTLRKAFLHPSVWSNLRSMVREVKLFGRQFRVPRYVNSSRGFGIRTFGWKADGIVGSGIPSLTRTEVWRKLGPWKAKGGTSIIDSSGGGESEMLLRWRRSGMPLQRAIPVIPVAADIITDPRGTKAKVRNNIRYGIYKPAVGGDFYYSITAQTELEPKLKNRYVPASFEEMVTPIGFELPVAPDGSVLKSGMNLSVVSKIIQ